MRRRIALNGAVIGALALSCAACGAGQALEAPISAIGATDVVVQQNLQIANEEVTTLYQESNSYASFGAGDAPSTGLTLTGSPSTGPKVVSYSVPASSGGQAIVLAAYNGATKNCYGIVDIGTSIATPILGATVSGIYDFTYPRVISTGCDAGLIAEYAHPLSGWPAGDPSGSGSWPKP